MESYYEILHSTVFNKRVNKKIIFLTKFNNKIYIIFDNNYEIFSINNKEYLKISSNNNHLIYKIYNNKCIKRFYFNRDNMVYSIKYNSDDNTEIFKFEIPKFKFLQEKFETTNLIQIYDK